MFMDVNLVVAGGGCLAELGCVCVWGGELWLGIGGLESPQGLGDGGVLCSTKEHFNESLKSIPPNVPWCGTCPCAVNNFSPGRGACCLLVKSQNSAHPPDA